MPKPAASATSGRPAGDSLALDLPALRAAVLTMPDSAPRLLRRQLPDPPELDEPGSHVDLKILLAEAFLRCRDTTAALQAARDAIHAAERLHPADSSRRLCAYGVAADVTLYAGTPAVAAYCTYLDQLAVTGNWSGDALRTVYARAGLAVATYREIDHQHGRQLLADLCEMSQRGQGRHHRVTITLIAGLAAMYGDRSAYEPETSKRSLPDRARPAPLPGGILCPDLTTPDRTYVASRVHHDVAGHREAHAAGPCKASPDDDLTCRFSHNNDHDDPPSDDIAGSQHRRR